MQNQGLPWCHHLKKSIFLYSFVCLFCFLKTSNILFVLFYLLFDIRCHISCWALFCFTNLCFYKQFGMKLLKHYACCSTCFKNCNKREKNMFLPQVISSIKISIFLVHFLWNLLVYKYMKYISSHHFSSAIGFLLTKTLFTNTIDRFQLMLRFHCLKAISC